MQNKVRDKCIVIGMILMMVLGLAAPVIPAMPVHAAAYALTIHYHGSQAGSAIDGAAFHVVMVAARGAGLGTYTLVDPYTGVDVDPNHVADAGSTTITADVRAAARKLLEAYVSGAASVTTGADGRATLAIDTAGLYLIWQTEGTGTAAEYNLADPILVYVPMVNDDGATWRSDITIEPKTSRKDTGGDDGGDGGDDGGSGGSDHGDHDGGSGGGSSEGAGEGSSTATTEPAEEPLPDESLPDETPVPGEETTPGDERVPDDQLSDEVRYATRRGSVVRDAEGQLWYIDEYGNRVDLWTWITTGGFFTGDNSPMRIYAAIAIFALVVLIAHALRNKLKQ